MNDTPEVVVKVDSCTEHPNYKGLRTKRVPCDTCAAIYEQVEKLGIKEKRTPWGKKSKKIEKVESKTDSVDNNVVSETLADVIPIVPVVAEAVCDPEDEDEVSLPEEDEFPVDEDDDDDDDDDEPIDNLSDML